MGRIKAVDVPIEMNDQTLLALRRMGVIEVTIKFKPEVEKFLMQTCHLDKLALPKKKSKKPAI